MAVKFAWGRVLARRLYLAGVALLAGFFGALVLWHPRIVGYEASVVLARTTDEPLESARLDDELAGADVLRDLLRDARPADQPADPAFPSDELVAAVRNALRVESSATNPVHITLRYRDANAAWSLRLLDRLARRATGQPTPSAASAPGNPSVARRQRWRVFEARHYERKARVELDSFLDQQFGVVHVAPEPVSNPTQPEAPLGNDALPENSALTLPPLDVATAEPTAAALTVSMGEPLPMTADSAAHYCRLRDAYRVAVDSASSVEAEAERLCEDVTVVAVPTGAAYDTTILVAPHISQRIAEPMSRERLLMICGMAMGCGILAFALSQHAYSNGRLASVQEARQALHVPVLATMATEDGPDFEAPRAGRTLLAGGLEMVSEALLAGLIVVLVYFAATRPTFLGELLQDPLQTVAMLVPALQGT